VAATLPVGVVPFPDRGTPILIMHGTKDTRVPWGGGNVTQNRGLCRSAEATRDYFVLVNNASAPPVEVTLPDLDPTDQCRIASQFYSNAQTPVLFYRLDGGDILLRVQICQDISPIVDLKLPLEISAMMRRERN
jgi:poly(3-hydroxybutyrate) depolymerase